jgi:hypothetical protein
MIKPFILLCALGGLPVVALPVQLQEQVRRGNLTYQEAQELNIGIREQRQPTPYNPADGVLGTYIAQMRAPGLQPQTLLALQQQATPVLASVSEGKLREYQAVVTMALNQAQSNLFTQEQYQASLQRETLRVELKRQEDAARFARERLIYGYGTPYPFYGRRRGYGVQPGLKINQTPYRNSFR